MTIIQRAQALVKNGGLPDNPTVKPSRKILAGGQRKKGEKLDEYNTCAHRAYKDGWVEDKKRSGKWLPKKEYERSTGRPGRKD